MDYPHPVINLTDEGKIDMSSSYAVGIGDWDKRTILYGYQDFPDGTDEGKALKGMINESIEDGYLFISDSDSRPAGGAHPYSHLWDNGNNPIDELKRLADLRADAMSRFGENSITSGTAYSKLENVLVPIYLAHRYQVEAVSKIIGGLNYSYAVKGDSQEVISEIVDASMQDDALNAMIGTLTPSFLEIPESILQLIPPAAFGINRNRETFTRYSSSTFDPIAAAEGSANHSLSFLLNKDRLTRIIQHAGRDESQFGAAEYLSKISGAIFLAETNNGIQEQIARSNQRLLVSHLIKLSRDQSAYGDVIAEALFALMEIQKNFLQEQNAHNIQLNKLIFDGLDTSKELKLPSMPTMPPGSPIGCY